MIAVFVKKQSHYPVSTPVLKKRLRNFLTEKGIVSDADVSVSIVGEVKMLELARKYLKEKNTLHNVLSFPVSEGGEEFVMPPDDILHLGEIIVCYPKAFSEAQEEGKRIEEKVFELVEHGALHLMGIHHD